MKAKELPQPECALGYTLSQINDIMGEEIQAFWIWLSGQTVSVCDGKYYEQEFNAYLDTGCGPHGTVIYYHDVRNFLAGGPVLD